MNMRHTLELTPSQPCERENWQRLKIKHRYQVDLGKMLQPEPSGQDDREVPYLRALHVQWEGLKFDELPSMWASPSEINALKIELGDLLVCEGGEVGRAARVTFEPPEDCIIQNAVHRVRVMNSGDVNFLKYVLRHLSSCGWLDVLCNRATIAQFTGEKFGDMWIRIPDLEEQRSIASYLDRETARLDSLIAAKENLLVLLVEKRKALIIRAVTRGLDHNVELKDSAIAWLGKIPMHWEVARVKHIASKIGSGKTPLGGADSYVGKGIPFIRSQNVLFSGLSLDEVVFIDKDTEEEMSNSRVQPCDVLLNITEASIGRCCSVAESLQAANVNQHVCIIRPRQEKMVTEFLNDVLGCDIGQWQVFAGEEGISREGLSFEDIGEFTVPLPPHEEQLEIVDYLRDRTFKLDALRKATERTIVLLKERRAAVITAAVTGKMSIENNSVTGSKLSSKSIILKT